MARASGPALPDIATALAGRRGTAEELGRVAERVADMVASAGLAALDATLELAERGGQASAAVKLIADDIAERAEHLEREVGRAILTAKPV